MKVVKSWNAWQEIAREPQVQLIQTQNIELSDPIESQVVRVALVNIMPEDDNQLPVTRTLSIWR